MGRRGKKGKWESVLGVAQAVLILGRQQGVQTRAWGLCPLQLPPSPQETQYVGYRGPPGCTVRASCKQETSLDFPGNSATGLFCFILHDCLFNEITVNAPVFPAPACSHLPATLFPLAQFCVALLASPCLSEWWQGPSQLVIRRKEHQQH